MRRPPMATTAEGRPFIKCPFIPVLLPDLHSNQANRIWLFRGWLRSRSLTLEGFAWVAFESVVGGAIHEDRVTLSCLK